MSHIRKYLDILTEAETGDSRTTLYHGTSSNHLAPLLVSGGVQSPSWWGTRTVAQYYAEEVAEEDGSNQAIIAVPLARFDARLLEPDDNSIAEPLTATLRKSEEQLYAEWQASAQNWRDSLRIYGSVLYRGGLVAVTPADTTVLREPPKQPPEKQVAKTYKAFLRILAWGRELSPQDQRTKQYIERKFDVSGIRLE